MSSCHVCSVTHITKRRPSAARTRHIEQSVDAVRRILRVLRVAEQQTQLETGISAAQMYVLRHLEETSPRSLSELADRTLTDRSSVADVVERLVERRLVRRVRDPRDGRRAAISITARGRSLVRRADPSPTAILVGGLRELTPSQLTSVSRSLDRLSRALGAHNGSNSQTRP